MVLNPFNDGFAPFWRLYDGLDINIKKTILNRFLNDNLPTVFYSNDFELKNKIILLCSTMSACDIDTSTFASFSEVTSLSEKRLYLSKRVISNSDIKNANKLLEKFEIKCTPLIVDRFLLSIYDIELEKGIEINLNVEKYGKLIIPSRIQSRIKPSEYIVRTRTKKEFDYHNVIQNFLVEGIYQFFKLCRQNNVEFIDENGKMSQIIELFIDIQVIRVLGRINGNRNELKSIPESKNKHYNKLKELGKQTFTRTYALSKEYSYSKNNTEIYKLKRRGYFPSRSNFFTIFRKNNLYNRHQELINLRNILDIKPDVKNYKSVFISYSFNDSKIAHLIYNFLVLNGIKVFLFEIDDPSGTLEDVMSEKVLEYDKLLFIASENSLKSEACQFELTKCREKLSQQWETTVIPTRIDDYIFKIEKSKIHPITVRKRYWKNIKMLKDNNVIDYSNFVDDVDCQKFQNEKIIKMIDEELLKV